MKLYNIIIVAMAVVASVSIQSCTDLEPELYSTILPEELNSNPKMFENKITDAYIGMIGEYGYVFREGYWNIQTGTTDEAIAPTRGNHWFDNGVHIAMHQHTWLFNTRDIENGWSFAYNGVSKSNEFLKFIRENKGEGPYDDVTASLISEAKVLRAFYHYLAMDVYGNIPIDSGMAVSDNVVQSKRKDVYNWIVKEITTNLPNLQNEHNYGRFTQPAAQALLARIYLNAEVYKRNKVTDPQTDGDPADYDKVIAACDAILNGGYGYELESDFSKVFAVNNQTSKEIIFPIVFDAVWAPGNMFHLMTYHYVQAGINQYKTDTWNGFCTLPEFYDSYNDNPNAITKADYQELANLAASNNTVAYQNKLNAINAVRAQCQDKRRDKTWLVGRLRPADQPYRLGGVDIDPVLIVDLDSIKASEAYQTFKGPRFKKFEVERGIGHHANNDFPLFRLADIYLMKAEAIMRKNGGVANAEAVNLVNVVRNRAGAIPYTTATLTMNELLAERGRELAWEGTRRTDLIRFDQYTKAWRFKGGATNMTDLYPAGESGRYRMILPIPKSVMDANPTVYTQNDQY